VLRLWSRQGDLVATFSIPDDPIASARFSADGKTLIARTRVGALRRYIIDPEELLDRFAWVEEPSEAQLREFGLR
jgi:hypothetical protein